MLTEEMKKQHLDRITDIIKAEFDKDHGDQESWEDLCCWVNAYFQSEDSADLSTKEMAEMLQGGFPAITAANMLEYFSYQIEGCEMEDEAEQTAMLEGNLQRVRDFFKPR